MMRWIVAICVAVLLIIASCMKVSGRCARQEYEIEYHTPRHCENCGQALQWEEENG